MADALIHNVEVSSIAADLSWKKGDIIHSINGKAIGDIIDYYLLIAEEEIEVLVEHEDTTQTIYTIEKDYDEDLGVTFNPATITQLKQCHNKCKFCFIDQMPPGHRPTLYVRDDDYRLSFVSGSYITGTNLSEAEIERIISLNLSPLYLSVHQTGPLRDELLGRLNSKPFDIMALLRRFSEGGILLHTQIVLCPGINDGEHLHQTLKDILELMPSILSIAIVPVGLTKFRDVLPLMKEYTSDIAASVIDTADEYGAKMLETFGSRIIYCSDELYVRAHRELPAIDYYETFAQYENGIGMIRLFIEEFEEAFAQRKDELKQMKFVHPVVIASGVLASPYLALLLERIRTINAGFSYEVVPIVNEFFGPTVTVAGLVTGGDIIKTLKNKYSPDTTVFIPQTMLQYDSEVFLDDMTVTEMHEHLQLDVKPLEVDGGRLVSAVIEKGGKTCYQ